MGSSSKGPALEPFIVFGVVAALCCLPFLARLADFRVHSEMTDLLAGDQRSLSSFEDADGQLANTLGKDSVAVILSLRADDVFAPEAVKDIQGITAALMEIPGFSRNLSLVAPRVKPYFIINWPQVRVVLGERLQFHSMDQLGRFDFKKIGDEWGNFEKAARVHVSNVLDLRSLWTKVLSEYARARLRGDSTTINELLRGHLETAWGNIGRSFSATVGAAVRGELARFKADLLKPIEPLRPLMDALQSNEQNSTLRDRGVLDELADLGKKVRIELGEIQGALERGGTGQVVRFGLGPIFPKPPGEMTPAERNATKHWTVNFPFFRNLIVDDGGQHAMIFAFADHGPATREAKAAFCRDVDQRLQPFRDRGLDIRLLSFPHGEVETMDFLEADLKRFLPAVFVILLVVLAVTFRFSIRLVVFVLVMQAVGIAMSLGLAPMLGSRISPFTVPLFPLLSGVHLTLLIHVGTALQSAQRSGLAGPGALSEMLGQVFKPSAFAALTTVVGMLSLSLSEVRPTREFGLLGAAGIGLLFVLTFGPGIVLLKLLGGRARPAADSSSPTSGWPEALPQWVVRWRGFVLAGMAGVVVLIFFGVQQIRTDIRIVEFLSPQSDTRQALEELNDAYGGVNFAKLEIDTHATGGVRRTEFFRFINDLQKFAEQQEGVSMVYSVGSLLSAADQVLQENLNHLPALTPARLRADMMIDQFERPEIREDLPLIDSLYDRDLRKAWLVLRTRDLPSGQYIDMLNAVEAEAGRIKPAGYTVSMQGAIQQIQKADRLIVDSQKRSALFTATLIALVLAVLWRSLGLALLAFVANLIPVGLVIALQGFAGVPLNSITIMVGAIAFSIAVDDTIHFITHWRGERSQGVPAREAVINTLRVKGRPIVSTTLILIGIMAVMALSSFPPVVAFGWLSAIGFAGALGAALLLLPLFLAGNREGTKDN